MVSTTAPTGTNHLPDSETPTVQRWLHSPKWDLTFLIFSIFIAVIPYSIYFIFGGKAFQTAEIQGTPAYNARVLVNTLVAIFVGGPHMYATFTRTILNRDFLRERRWLLGLSFLIPVAVFTMAVATYQTYVWLLTIFFAMASIHALHQLIWVTEAYNRKARWPSSILSRLIDYGVVLTSLYPIAVWKMVEGKFKIGPMALKFNEIMGGQWWLVYLSFTLFLFMLAAFVFKTLREIREGHFNLPKTLLISLTVMLMFLTPLFPNMDTSFQGINVWHSFQYLALTWYANRLHQQRTRKPIGSLQVLPAGPPVGEGRGGDRTEAAGGRSYLIGRLIHGFRKIDRNTGWTPFYLQCVVMLTFSGLLIVGAKAWWPNLHNGLPGADEAYAYMGILSVLLVHYAHDALLFFQPDSLIE